MNRQPLIISSIAVLVAGILTYFILQMLDLTASKEQPKSGAATMVLVASRDLATATKITAKDITWQTWSNKALSPEFAIKGTRAIKDFLGAIVRWPIAQGQPVMDKKIIQPEHYGFMASLINPNMRAVAIEVDKASGVAGLISPGDQVDLILTHRLDDQSKNFVSETILQGIVVLALDQRVSRSNQDDKVKLAKTVTVEVTPRQAEIIAIARSLGRLSLSLHSISNVDVTTTNKRLTTQHDFSNAYKSTSPRNGHITLIKGGKKEQLIVEGQ